MKALWILLAFELVFRVAVLGDMTDDQIMNYLTTYAYAGERNPSDDIAGLMDTDQTLAMWAGCMMFQEKFNLTMTGDCRDAETTTLMEMPRCGNTDINNMEQMMTWDAMLNFADPGSRRRKRFALQGSAWPKLDLTYNIIQYSPDLTVAQIDEDISLAFQVWSEVTPLTFTRVATNPDIEIAFTPTNHGDGFPFDGPSGTLAHAFFPEFGGDAHFDEAELWTVNTPAGINLFQVAAHEFGHALGLSHSDSQTALMAPFYAGYIPVNSFQLDTDDIQGIQALYGAPGMTMSPTGGPDQGQRDFPDLPEGAPNICNDATFDAIFNHFVNGQLKTFAFSGEYYIELDDFGLVEGYPRRIADDWDGIVSVDAALNFDTGFVEDGEGEYALQAYTYIFTGSVYYRIENMRVVEGPFSIQTDWGLPSDLDAAFQYSGNGLAYFIKDDQYYRLSNVLQTQPDVGYPRPLSIWSEQFVHIDAAFQHPNRRTYFFTGDQYYRYNDAEFDVDEGYPRSNDEAWIGCPDNFGNDETGKANTLTHSLLSVLLPIVTTTVFFRLSQKRDTVRDT